MKQPEYKREDGGDEERGNTEKEQGEEQGERCVTVAIAARFLSEPKVQSKGRRGNEAL